MPPLRPAPRVCRVGSPADLHVLYHLAAEFVSIFRIFRDHAGADIVALGDAIRNFRSAWRDSIHPDAVFSVFHRQNLAQCQDAVLAGRIGKTVKPAHGLRAKIDDGSGFRSIMIGRTARQPHRVGISDRSSSISTSFSV